MASLSFIIIFSVFLTSCQVKQTSPDAGLISGHQQVENNFSVSVPINGIYLSGASLIVRLNHPFPITVSGNPRLQLILGSGNVNANYVSGSGSKELIFSYVVQAADSDIDGIGITSTIDLNGGQLKFGTNSDASTSLTIPSTSGIKVNSLGPQVLNVNSLSAGTNSTAAFIDFAVTYSRAVNVLGSPQLVLDIGGMTKYATYFAGSGSAVITYRYQVENGLSDKNGVQVTGHVLNSGTVTDTFGYNAICSNANGNFATTLVDSRGPLITSITPPSSGRKISGDTLSFTVNFDEDVSVLGGTPSLSLDIGGVTVTANYTSGSGSSALVFTTTALTATHFDPAGISYLDAFLTPNSATLRDTLSFNADLNFTQTDISGIKVIYSEVISWLDVSTSPEADNAVLASLADLSAATNNATADSGSVTKILSDAGLANRSAANFDGSSSLLLPMMAVKTMVIAFKTSTAPSNANILSDGSVGLTLLNGIDLDFGAMAKHSVNGAALAGVSANCVSCYNHTTTKVIMVNYMSVQAIAPLLGSGLDGRISEVWILNGTQGLSNAQLERISTYLNSKY